MTAARENQSGRPPRHALLLWVAYLAPALAWFGQLNASFLIAAYGCTPDRMWLMHLISAMALVIAGAGMWSGWRSRRYEDKSRRNGRFLTVMALVLGALFALSIVANEIPNHLAEPCR